MTSSENHQHSEQLLIVPMSGNSYLDFYEVISKAVTIQKVVFCSGIRYINPESTGPFAPSTALGGCFLPPSVKLDPEIQESLNFKGLITYIIFYKTW